MQVEPRIGDVGHRRPRLSDEETARRMLRVAAEAIGRDGLKVSLDHVRLEDVIREAGVSRSSAYRRWPHKDLFLGDLLLELAGEFAPAATGTRTAPEVVRSVLMEHPARLRTQAGREEMLREILRTAAERDFEHNLNSPRWRTYLALTVTAVGLPPGQLKDRVRETLTQSERGIVEHIAATFQMTCELLGMRPRVDYLTIAQVSNAIMRGFVSKALADPEMATPGLVGLGAVGVADAYIEPEDTTEWDDARIARAID